jgi:hypothetical protein
MLSIEQINNENELVKENAEYVLGMYDLYANDEEIVQMLRMKGLNEDLVQRVLSLVKKPTYVKRIKQAKRMILIAGLIFFVMVVLPYVLKISAGGSPKLLLKPNSIEYDREREGIIFFYFKWLLGIAWYVISLVVIQFIIGFSSLVKYSRLLRKLA